MYLQDLALSNLQGFICHKANKQKRFSVSRTTTCAVLLRKKRETITKIDVICVNDFMNYSVAFDDPFQFPLSHLPLGIGAVNPY